MYEYMQVVHLTLQDTGIVFKVRHLIEVVRFQYFRGVLLQKKDYLIAVFAGHLETLDVCHLDTLSFRTCILLQ